MPHDQLKQDAGRLNELGKLVVRAFIESDYEGVAARLTEYLEIKRGVNEYLIANPSIQLPGNDCSEVRSLLARISTHRPLAAEAALISKLVSCDLDADDFEEIGREELYSWMSHVEYAEGLWKAGSLIVACGILPKNVMQLVGEARQCFAFQQYNAVSALCRAIIEVALRDVALVLNLLPSDRENVSHLQTHGGLTLQDLIDKVTSHPPLQGMRGRLHTIRKSINPVVHGSKLVGEEQALSSIRQTLSGVHDLYEVVGEKA